MTVGSSTYPSIYTGNGSTTVFTVQFYFLDEAHLAVYVTTDGVAVLKTLGTDYTVSGAKVSSGGSVTFTSAPASGTTISILLDIPTTQETSYPEGDPFPAKSHENALDKLTLIAQQIKALITRCLTFPVSEANGGDIPSVTSRANSVLAFDATGKPVAIFLDTTTNLLDHAITPVKLSVGAPVWDPLGHTLIGLSLAKPNGGPAQVVPTLDVVSSLATEQALLRVSNYNALDSTPTYDSLNILKHGPSQSGNLYCSTTLPCADWSEIVALNSYGLAIGTNNSGPLVFGAGGVEKFRIPSSGPAVFTDMDLQMKSGGSYNPQMQLYAASAIAGSAGYFILNKSRGTIASPSTVQSGDTLGTILFQGYDGSAYSGGSYFSGIVNGTVSAGVVPIDLNWVSGGTARFKLSNSGEVLVVGPSGLGYGAGAGGSVTQATNKSTAVTLNKPCGQITMSNASLAAGATVTFTVNNSLISQTDVVHVSIGNVGTGLTYEAWVSFTSNTGFYVTLKNISGGALAEAVVINFAVLRGVTA